MDIKELTDILCGLVAIPSLSRQEQAAADFLYGRLVALGLEPHRAGCNLWVESEPASEGKPTLLLNAHIDTVKPSPAYTRDPFLPSIEGDRLYGLGANDDGGCVVALLEAFLRLSAKPQPYRLVYSATAEEEVTGENGIDLIFPEIGPVAFGVIGEPTCMQMAVAERGLMVLDCTETGKSGHAARNEGVNALYKAVDDIQWLRGYHFPKVSPWLGEVKMTATVIEAGTQHNVVPAECKFVVDVRPNGEYSNEEILQTIRAHVQCDARPRSMRHSSSSIDARHPAVLRGKSLGLACFGSPTTSNQTRCGFPTLKIGPGDSARSHSADEFILLSEVENSVDIYESLLDGLEII